MASTYTPALRAELVGIGDQVDTWGTTENSNFLNVFEAAIAGLAAVTMVNANKTLTVANNAADESRPMILSLTSGVALTAQRDVIVPSGAGVTKTWIVRNATTGGFPIRVKTAAGTGVVVPNGQTRLVYCDGTNVLNSITGAPAWTVDAGLTVTSGGLTVTAGGVAITGNSTVTGSLTVTGALTAASLSGGAADSLVPVGTIRATAAILLSDPGWLYCNGNPISRTTYSALFAKITRSMSPADSTLGSPTLTGSGFVVGGLRAGMPISGPGIPPGTTIILPLNGTTITMSANATASAVGITAVICPWGEGDGSTTFNLPDFRGRVIIGGDSMGAGGANRITSAVSGIDALRIGAGGGNQLYQQHLHAVTDPGHGHSTNNPAHGHAIIDPGHGHNVADPWHSHGNGSSGGNIAFANANTYWLNPVTTAGGNYIGYGSLAPTEASPTGIGIVVSPSWVTVANGTTAVSVNNNTTGVSVQNSGTGTSGNVQPSAVCNVLIKH